MSETGQVSCDLPNPSRIPQTPEDQGLAFKYVLFQMYIIDRMVLLVCIFILHIFIYSNFLKCHQLIQRIFPPTTSIPSLELLGLLCFIANKILWNKILKKNNNNNWRDNQNVKQRLHRWKLWQSYGTKLASVSRCFNKYPGKTLPVLSQITHCRFGLTENDSIFFTASSSTITTTTTSTTAFLKEKCKQRVKTLEKAIYHT